MWLKVFRLVAVGMLLIGILHTASFAGAPDKVTVGALRFTSSGPVFLALDRGYFREAGLDVEVVFFQDAPTVAAATASRDITFGVTALTAAMFNLASQGRLKILAGQAQEKKGHSGNLILVTKRQYDSGLNRLEKLFDQPFGLTQLGSPSHYQLGQLANAHGVAASTLEIRAFQNLPNLVAALKTGAVTWAIIAPPIATDLIDAGAAVSLAPYSNYGSYQFGGVFASGELVTEHPEIARNFLAAYKKGLGDYSEIVTNPASIAARDAARVVGRYVYADQDPEKAADRVLNSALYVDPAGNIDVEDVKRQIAWYYANGMLKSAPEVSDILRLDLLQ